MCFISVGRYLGIQNPLHARHANLFVSRRAILLRILLAWLLSAFIASPLTIMAYVDTTNIVPEPNVCAITNPYFLFLGSFTAFFIPMIVMVNAYVMTVRLLSKRAEFVRNNSINDLSNTATLVSYHTNNQRNSLLSSSKKQQQRCYNKLSARFPSTAANVTLPDSSTTNALVEPPSVTSKSLVSHANCSNNSNNNKNVSLLDTEAQAQSLQSRHASVASNHSTFHVGDTNNGNNIDNKTNSISSSQEQQRQHEANHLGLSSARNTTTLATTQDNNNNNLKSTKAIFRCRHCYHCGGVGGACCNCCCRNRSHPRCHCHCHCCWRVCWSRVGAIRSPSNRHENGPRCTATNNNNNSFVGQLTRECSSDPIAPGAPMVDKSISGIYLAQLSCSDSRDHNNARRISIKQQASNTPDHATSEQKKCRLDGETCPLAFIDDTDVHLELTPAANAATALLTMPQQPHEKLRTKAVSNYDTATVHHAEAPMCRHRRRWLTSTPIIVCPWSTSSTTPQPRNITREHKCHRIPHSRAGGLCCCRCHYTVPVTSSDPNNEVPSIEHKQQQLSNEISHCFCKRRQRHIHHAHSLHSHANAHIVGNSEMPTQMQTSASEQAHTHHCHKHHRRHKRHHRCCCHRHVTFKCQAHEHSRGCPNASTAVSAHVRRLSSSLRRRSMGDVGDFDARTCYGTLSANITDECLQETTNITDTANTFSSSVTNNNNNNKHTQEDDNSTEPFENENDLPGEDEIPNDSPVTPLSVQTGVGPTGGSGTSATSNGPQMLMRYLGSSMQVRNEQKATKVLGVVFFTFAVCWTPFFTLNAAQAFIDRHDMERAIPPQVLTTFQWLGYLSSTINPVIYTVFNRNFRRAFRRILLCQRLSSSRRYQQSDTNKSFRLSFYGLGQRAS
ncbi:5-hydroxytryptamine receptor 2A [Fragariocoptes setiger]|uniref:5-hydroxytryptamine receptor 2A n=1 Tax=Fragariocoptes setiger TaxID=1670756 RepID=A0ABQ7SCI2_9ACAR|nr:5-hydroxytryptamine receptor 2A [Fragariocoptes setiger]